jgi:hypothetical protein
MKKAILLITVFLSACSSGKSINDETVSDTFKDTFISGDDGGCIPQCPGKECGSNGCGGTCGTCKNGFCSEGKCVADCKEWEKDCKGECVDLLTNFDHCGDCNKSCALDGTVTQCVNGNCVFISCESRYINDNGDFSDGCEKNCQGVTINSEGTLVFDIPLLSITGNVTQNGGGFDASQSGTAENIRIRDLRTGFDTIFINVKNDLKTTSTYKRELVSGTYDFYYDSDVCTEGTPCPYFMLNGHLKVSAEGAINFDIPYISLTGKVTMNGGAFSKAALNGNERIMVKTADSVNHEALLFSVKNIADAGYVYKRRIVPGNYSIIYKTDTCVKESPCPHKMLMQDGALNADGALNIDIPVYKVTGKVSVNGSGVKPLNPTASDAVWIIEKQSDYQAVMINLNNGISQDSSYERHLVPQQYDFQYRTLKCTKMMPCPYADLYSGFEVSGTGVLNFEIPTVHISGTVTVNGETVDKKNASSSENIYIRRTGKSDETNMLSLASDISDKAVYEREIVPAKYDLTYRAYQCS